MENENKILMTKKGLKKLKDEYKYLVEVKREEISNKIKVAREQGDISENAEYDAAKEEQEMVEIRIEEIDRILRNATVVEELGGDKVNIGCNVVIYNVENKKELSVTIVGSNEVNSLEGKISNISPLGAALMGLSVGEEVSIKIKNKKIKYKIKSINLSK